tara:strand:- start:4132 stop:4854 length:723 start_codon:yes stop_codon:yes gene_type:complete
MKKMIITGASSGIGKTIAQTLITQGYFVIGLSREKGFEHKHYQHYSIDFACPRTLESKLNEIRRSQNDIDGVIFSCGMGLFGQIEQLSTAQIKQLMNVNFISQAITAKIFLPQMKGRSRGDLIFIGSEAGLQGQTQGSIYCASKFALRGFCQSLRSECAKANIRCCIIEPGACRTPFFDKLHFEPGPETVNAIDSSSIAEAVAFILNLPQNTIVDELILSPQKKCMRKSITTLDQPRSRV